MVSLSVSQDKNPIARSMYNRLGFSAADAEPVRVTGQITLRGQPFEVDDTLIYMIKRALGPQALAWASVLE